MNHDDTAAPTGRSSYPLLRMRGPADMAAMLPYLLGFYPDDSIVAVSLHGAALQQVGAIRVDIPEDPATWAPVATEVATTLVELSAQRGKPAQAVLLYLCRDPEPDGAAAITALRPLAAELLRAFREADLTVKELLCVSAGRWWSFLCADPDCCAPEGIPVETTRDPRAVVAAATFAGLAPRGSRKAIAAGLAPVGPPQGERIRHALERQMAQVVRELAKPDGPARVMRANAELIAQAMAESRTGPPPLDDDRTARLIVALQHRVTRDRGAEYAEPEELAAALRLWRFLSRQCVAPYEEYAKAPLTLLAWTSWLAGDTATSRVALGMALELDPDYTLAELLYLSLNGGLPPDGLREIIRAERARRAAQEADPEARAATPATAGVPDRADPGASPTAAAPVLPRPVDEDDAGAGSQPPGPERAGPVPGSPGSRQRQGPPDPADDRARPAGPYKPDLIHRQRGGGAPPPRPPVPGVSGPEPGRPPEGPEASEECQPGGGQPWLPARGRPGRSARRSRHRRAGKNGDRTIGGCT
ncbi:DUF4192 domain-containing protein [Kitasatospora sp. NPDC058965]|uniref:DUF4192 domain-containing protein n=1 Tax=Kitasatospora sp. NPDC058965 TaxID=3346682 RepID=UPI0036C19CD9